MSRAARHIKFSWHCQRKSGTSIGPCCPSLARLQTEKNTTCNRVWHVPPNNDADIVWYWSPRCEKRTVSKSLCYLSDMSISIFSVHYLMIEQHMLIVRSSSIRYTYEKSSLMSRCQAFLHQGYSRLWSSLRLTNIHPQERASKEMQGLPRIQSTLQQLRSRFHLARTYIVEMRSPVHQEPGTVAW